MFPFDPSRLPRRFTVTPTVDTSIYAAGDAIGTYAKLTKVSDAQNTFVYLRSVVITDLAKQSPALKLIFFDTEPTTSPTTNAAYDPTDAELANVVKVVVIPNTVYAALNDNGVGEYEPVGGIAIPMIRGTSLWVQVVAGGTPTFAADGDLSLKLTFAK